MPSLLHKAPLRASLGYRLQLELIYGLGFLPLLVLDALVLLDEAQVEELPKELDVEVVLAVSHSQLPVLQVLGEEPELPLRHGQVLVGPHPSNQDLDDREPSLPVAEEEGQDVAVRNRPVVPVELDRLLRGHLSPHHPVGLLSDPGPVAIGMPELLSRVVDDVKVHPGGEILGL